MSIDKVPSGSRGARTPPRLLMKIIMPVMRRVHRAMGDRFNGTQLLYLTTIGARSGARRTAQVARFDDGAGGWYVIASFGGAAQHPAWYHNVVAHPDQVWAEVDGVTHRVTVTQLDGDDRRRVWEDVVRQAPGFGDYETKTDRVLPLLRLTPTASIPADGEIEG